MLPFWLNKFLLIDVACIAIFSTISQELGICRHVFGHLNWKNGKFPMGDSNYQLKHLWPVFLFSSWMWRWKACIDDQVVPKKNKNKIDLKVLDFFFERKCLEEILTWLHMDRTWGSNPISNIRSASSRTI